MFASLRTSIFPASNHATSSIEDLEHGSSDVVPEPSALQGAASEAPPSQMLNPAVHILTPSTPSTLPPTKSQTEPTYDQPSTETGYPETPLQSPALPIDWKSAFWAAYNEARDGDDKSFITGAGRNLNILLLSAGLFSIINLTFIIENFRLAERNQLLRFLIYTTQELFSSAPDTYRFYSRSPDIRVNKYFLASFCCTTCVFFGALLAKQWVTHYNAGEDELKEPSDRGRVRQLKYESLQTWRLEFVIATLPIRLFMSLFIFLIGFADSLWPMDTAVAMLAAGFLTSTFLLWLMINLISTIHPESSVMSRLSRSIHQVHTPSTNGAHPDLHGTSSSAPGTPSTVFRTSPYRQWPKICIHIVGVGLAALLRVVRRPIVYLSNVQFDKDISEAGVDSRCIAYLLEKETLASRLEILAHALDSLPTGTDPALIASTLITFHLKPSHEEWWHLPGLLGPARKPLLKILHTLFVKWRYLEVEENTIIQSSPPLGSRSLLHSLRPELSKLSLMDPGDPEAHALIIEILLALPEFSPGYPDDNEWYTASKWLESSISPHLQNDDDPALQQRSLTLLVAASASFNPRRTFGVIQRNLQTCTGIQRYLTSTMWADLLRETANLDNFWMGILRVQILPVVQGDLLGSGFAEYLAAWFKHYAVPDWKTLVRDRGRINRGGQEEEEQRWVYWSYIFALSQLLGGADGQKWSQELGKHGHESCVSIILRDYPSESPFLGAPFALRSLLHLWNHSASSDDLSQPSSLHLTEEQLRMITGALTFKDLAAISAESLCPYGPILFADTNTGTVDYRLSGEIAETAIWVFRCFEGAVAHSPAREFLGEALPHYRRWCEEVDYRRPGGSCKAHWETLSREMAATYINDEMDSER